MKYVAEFEVRVIEPDAPKGEELYREVETAIGQMDIEGCEVNELSVVLDRKDAKASKSKEAFAKDIAKEVITLLNLPLDAPDPANSKWTVKNAVMFLLKTITEEDRVYPPR